MKKLAFLTCAVFLASIVLTSCKKDENEPKQQNEVVKTEFSIELPNQIKSGPNRMPSATVQAAGRTEFQGMTNITLVPYAFTRAITSTDARLGNNITLGDIADASELGTNSNAKVYTNVSIPLATASFLFYAKSKASGTNFNVGVLNAVNLDDSHENGAFEFDLQTIIANLATAHGDAKAVALLAYVNSIANAVDGESTPRAWKTYDPTDPTHYNPVMASLFSEYKKLHFLSTSGIQRMVTDLYNSMAPYFTTNTLAANIKTAIEASATATETSAGSGVYTVALGSSLTGYPTDLNLPDGAIHIVWDDVTTGTGYPMFRFCTESEYTAANHAVPSQYVYPAALWYYANSQIQTANSSQQDKYNATNTWADILGYHTAGVKVGANTRAVAITDPIQYGVARMDVQVKLSAGTLEDNTPTTPQNVVCASYPVTAVLIGGQKNVGWDFTPVGANIYTIYDKVMTDNTMAATTSYSAMNSTLVLETAGGTGSDKDIRIAIEFTNNSGVDFIGVDGCLIPAGSKFYAVANLSAAAAGETDNKVFKQDYTTTVKLNLLSLKNVYNTIPDLRTPKLELGFSVDLEWQSGHEYAIDIN